MNIKSKIIVLSACIAVICGLGFWVLQIDKLKQKRFVTKEKPVSIQLIPLPMIVDGAAHKDSRLYELLVDKKAAQVTLANVDLDIESIFMMTPSGLKNLSICFTFNKETNRVEFHGQSNNLKHLKISGHYELTSKNNIRYYINIHDKYKIWAIDATYAPAYRDNELEHEEVVTGKFSLEAPDLLKAAYDFDNHSILPEWPLALQASFVKKENFLNIKNLYLKANKLEASINAKVKDKNLILDVALNDVNLDKIFSYISEAEMDRALSVVFKKISLLNVKGNLNCSRATFNGVKLQSVSVAFSQKEKTKNNLEISKLKFSFPDDSIFNSSGKMSRVGVNFVIGGSFNVSDVNANILAKILGIKNYTDKSLVSLSSKFKLAPRYVKLKGFKVKENATVVTGDLSFSKYISSKMLTGDIEISNYSTELPSFVQFILHRNLLLSNTRNLNYEISLEQNKKEKFLKDIALKFLDLKTTAGVVKKISTRYIETPNSIELEHFKAEDPKFNVTGSIGFRTTKIAPDLSMKFEGDRVNMVIFNDIILKPLMYQTNHNNKIGGLFAMPRFNLATGNVSIHLKNPDKNAYLSKVDCKARLGKQTFVLNNCIINLFDGQANLNGKFGLGKNLEYDIRFSHKNVNMNKFVSWLLDENKKITGKGNADIKGNFSASGFSTSDEMINGLNGSLEFQSDQISLTDINVKSLAFKYGKIKNIAKAGQRGKTIFNNVRGVFDLVNGKIKSRDLSFITKDNIHGKTNLSYKLADKNMDGILSLAYFDRVGKIDGFNITFYGNVKNLNTKLGTYTDRDN